MKTTILDTRYVSDKEIMNDYGYILEEEWRAEELADLTDDEKLDYLRKEHNSNMEHILDDTRYCLNVKGDYIMIADLGLWDGRRIGYKMINNLIDATYGDDYYDIRLETNAYDFKVTGYHHDGTNYITVREIKDTLSDIQLDNFLDKLYYGKLKKGDISRYTKSVKKDVLRMIGAI